MIGILQPTREEGHSSSSSASSSSASSSSASSSSSSSASSSSSNRAMFLLPNETPEITADPDDPALLSRQLVVLSRLIWGTGRATYTPHEIVRAVWSAFPYFEGHEQHDR